jgi:hypothetical protein
VATEDLTLLAEEEIRGFRIFREKYRALNPPPTRPSPVKQGWEFTAYILVSVASVLLASMRTAEQFYRAAAFSANPILGFIEAFLAIFTVESGIVVYAAVLASRSKKISQWVLVLGIILLSAISITAGLGQSLHLATELDPIFIRYTEYALLLLIGPGASVAALIGGHILGQQIAMAAQEYENMLKEYEANLEEYNNRIKRAWDRSGERKVVRVATSLTPVSMEDAGQPSISSEVTKWLLMNGKTPFDNDLNPVVIADELGHDHDLVQVALEKMRNNGR